MLLPSSTPLPRSGGTGSGLSQSRSWKQHSSLHPRRQRVWRRHAVAAPVLAAANSSLARITPQGDRRQLSNPAKIGARSAHAIKVQDRGGAVSLEQYMRLPSEAYAQLEPGMIVPLGGSRFLLRLPRVSMFHVWVAPEVEVSVSQREGPPRVVLESNACHLPGSPFFRGIEGRFALHFCTELTWRSSAPAGGQRLLLPALAPAPAPAATLPPAGMVPLLPQDTADTLWDKICRRAAGRSGEASEDGSGSNGILSSTLALWRPRAAGGAPIGAAGQVHAWPVDGEITGNLSVEVWSEVPPPFSFFPREAVEGTCNAVLRSLIGALLPLFMRRLGEDYEKWASDVSYREARAQEAAVRRATG